MRLGWSARIGVWAPLSPAVYARRRRSLPFPLDQPGCRLFARARHGLWHGLRALGLRSGDAVLVPAYHHGSEVEAILAAGLSCRFYDPTADLSPDQDQLESLLAGDVRALHLTHFFGFPQDGAKWRRWCDERGLLLIEDAAPAWLAYQDGEPVGGHGDLAVFCLYKTLGLPDGAAVVCRAPIPGPSRARRLGGKAVVRRHLAWAGQLGMAPIDNPKRPDYDAVADFALGDPYTPASLVTMAALPRLDPLPIAETRRANYRVLLGALRTLVRAPFDTVPDGASPFVFPVYVPDKSRLLDALRSERVHALDLWSVPHPWLNPSAHPAAQQLRNHLVGLPVHQELSPAQVRRIADLTAAVAV